MLQGIALIERDSPRSSVPTQCHYDIVVTGDCSDREGLCSRGHQFLPIVIMISLLQGIALIEKDAVPEVIGYYPVEDLPEDVGERFNQLFKTREKWSLADISPYIRYKLVTHF